MPVNEVVVNVFFSFFCGAVVVSGHHNDVPPRGGARVRRLIFTPVGEIIFFCLDRQCEVLHFDVKHC